MFLIYPLTLVILFAKKSYQGDYSGGAISWEYSNNNRAIGTTQIRINHFISSDDPQKRCIMRNLCNRRNYDTDHSERIKEFVSRILKGNVILSSAEKQLSIKYDTLYCRELSQEQNWINVEILLTVHNNMNQNSLPAVFNISYFGGKWRDNQKGYYHHEWDLHTTINQQIINTSPTSHIYPVIRIPINCETEIQIPVKDKESDRIKCIWTVDSHCYKPETTTVDENNCLLNFKLKSDLTIGIYPIRLQIEDYRDNKRLSRVPLEFVIQTYITSQCTKKRITFGPQPSLCSKDCRNGGTCSAPDTCSCTNQWKGINCELPICSKTCQNGGTCSFPNTCTCSNQWHGKNCELPICRQPCLNGGTCSAPDTCSCTNQWKGKNCCRPICTRNCQNGGTCSASDTCTCTIQWKGIYCDRPICTQNCQNGGTCSAPDTCTCSNQWNGKYCETPICKNACQNGGTCSAPDTCTCSNQWNGKNCELPICRNPCQNGGTCSAPDTCTCTNQWKGINCETPICKNACQNGGTCSAHDTCSCTNQWKGINCETPICKNACQNGGSCSAPDTCTCSNEWKGINCELPICKNACQNGGTCSAPDTCLCLADRTGNFCETILVDC